MNRAVLLHLVTIQSVSIVEAGKLIEIANRIRQSAKSRSLEIDDGSDVEHQALTDVLTILRYLFASKRS